MRYSRAAREDAQVDYPPEDALIKQVRALPAAAALLARVGAPAGVHLVGGAVRDLLLRRSPSELDLVVEGDALAFARQLGGEFRAHDRFGTSTVISDGFTYDIARARRERYARPGGLPDVEPATLEQDLQRRDFTINAVAIALDDQRPGALTAVASALADLSAGRLRVLHDRSFIDDPTRLLRLVRYATRLQFAVEPHTAELARAAVAAGALATVSGARLGSELRLLAREQDPVSALQALRPRALDTEIDPGFGLADRAAADRALELLPPDGRRDLLALGAGARGVPADRLTRLLDELAFEASERERIIAVATRSEELARRLQSARRPSEIAAAAAVAAPEVVAFAGALGSAEPAREWLQRLRHVGLEIDGADLLAAGVKQGPAIGRGLRAALAAKLDGRARGREAELDEALRGARER